jgi:cytochrome c oxidase subunit II
MRSMLDPAGPQAAHIADLWWWMLWVFSAVFLLVIGALLIALFRARVRERTLIPPPEVVAPTGRERMVTWVVAASVGGTVAVLFLFLVANVVTGHRLALLTGENAVTIRLTGYKWWWKIEYPDPLASRQVTTANEIHIPVGRPILINTYSQDVIHSLWIAPLHGKRDLIPGNPSAIWLQADRPGRFEGQCAEFCGLQHAHMRLLVIAEPEGQYQAWLDAQRQAANPPADALARRGLQVFETGPCALCHSIRGTEASGQTGPDLTHVASRATLAAGILPNSAGSLAGWIVDPQHIKPGTAMPANSLSPEDLQAVLAYLGGLR